MLLIETAAILLALVTAAIFPRLARSSFEVAESTLGEFAKHPTLSVVLIGIFALLLRLAALPVEPIPEPIVHDEFGYLLAADTFAHGRLTNPTHPMWEHFETFSILQKPTYQCFAQPAQGMVLALGKVLFGHTFWGVWLSAGLMCAAITWMLQGWVSPGWALLGGFLAILRYGVFTYWADSYWGGAVSAIGGALVLGALPRIKKSQRIGDAVWMGIGLALLANSRPYEGFVFCLPVSVALLIWIFRKSSPPLRVTLSRTIVPLALLLAVTGAGLGYYLWKVTGSPFRMPYQIERETYAVAPYMLWQNERPEPVYHHAEMRKMYVEEELVGYRFFKSFPGFLMKIYVGWSFFLGPALTVPLLMLAIALPRGFSWREMSDSTFFLLSVFMVSAVAWSLESFYNPHYSAPATGLILLFVLLSMETLRQWSPRGIFLSRVIIVTCVLSFGLRALAAPLHIRLPEFYEFAWYQKGPDDFGRAAVEAQLLATPGKHLVMVRYEPEHEPFAEWVYNEADIDNSKIVWAREMGNAENQPVFDYFKERQVWFLDADKKPPALVSGATRENSTHPIAGAERR